MELESSADEGEGVVQEAKSESSDFESFSEDSDEPSQNVVTQKDVFGSDTESEGKPAESEHPAQSLKAPVVSAESSENELDSPEPQMPVAEQASHASRAPLDPLSSDDEQTFSPTVPSAKVPTDGDSHGDESGESPERDPQPSTSSRSKKILSESDDDDEEEEVGRVDATKRTTKQLFDEDEDLGDDGTGLEEDEDGVGQNGDALRRSDEEEPEEDEVPDETRIAVDFPLIRSDLGREMHLVKMPNFLSVETRPFDPNFYEDELDEDEVLDEEGRTRLKLKVENTIRWRVANTPEGELVHESNARIVRWSDGSLSLHLGDEIFDIHKVDIHSDFNYLFIREGSGLQGQSSLRTKLTFRPHSTDSFTHRKITLSLADKTNKSQKVKILPMAGSNPETNRMALVRKEEEKLRATLRRESQLRRMRERQAMSRSSGFGGHSGERRRSGHAAGHDDDDDDDDDDGNTTSLNALKRNAKNAFAASRRDISAIYSPDSESLSDISEPRRKIRARISDDEADLSA